MSNLNLVGDEKQTQNNSKDKNRNDNSASKPKPKSIKRCPKCRSINPPDAKYCQQCGKVFRSNE